jgi:hypothetical protein
VTFRTPPRDRPRPLHPDERQVRLYDPAG